MEPITFAEVNAVFAKNQPKYLPLPAWRGKDGEVISCWKLNFKERLKVLLTGKMWLKLLTFGNPLQPQKLSVDHPFRREGSK